VAGDRGSLAGFLHGEHPATTICGNSPRQRFDLTVNKLTADAFASELLPSMAASSAAQMWAYRHDQSIWDTGRSGGEEDQRTHV